MRSIVLIPLIAVIVFVSGCGSVTGIAPTKPHTLSELTGYDKVIVLDFNNGTKSKEPERIKMVGKDFADRIATQITFTGVFNDVSRVQTPGKALVLEGIITRCEEGDAFWRMMVGCGAGSSYFDSNIVFKDNESGTRIATLKVDKNSWVLGGGIASTQTVYTFMDEAAKKVSQELSKIKVPKQK